MPVRLIMVLLLLSPSVLIAKQGDEAEQDMELFEFLALFEQKDEIYIDEEINDIESKDETDTTSPKAVKSESDEK